MREAIQAARPEPPAAWWTSGQDAQVFVDSSGRRARGVRAAGLAVAGVCAFWLVGLTGGMTGFSEFPTIGVRVLAHAAVARPGTLHAGAGVERPVSERSQAASAAARGRTADAESSARGLSCSASRTVAPAGRLQSAQRRPAPHRAQPSSTKSALGTAAGSACLTEVAAARVVAPALT